MTDEAALWLVVGGDSTIGSALVRQATAAGRRVIGTSRKWSEKSLRLDLADDSRSWVLPERVGVAYLCAAVTSMDACRTSPGGTRWINVVQTTALARLLAARGARVVFLSTNQVFDGSKPHRPANDPTCPRSEYGRQKADAEHAILDCGGSVIRFTKVMAEKNALFQSWATTLRADRKSTRLNSSHRT
mgnify:CR=1 FL=1